MADVSAAVGDVARYADLLCALDGLEDRRRVIERELAGLRETVVPDLLECGSITLEARSGVDVSLWVERDPEDGSLNVESRICP